MQTILLCEYFARFRGRKAVVRPSKLFESLYSRVSGSESLVSSASDGDCFSAIHVSLSDSSSIPSSFSSPSVGLYTPTIPAWSPQPSEHPSTSSPDNGLYAFDHIIHDNSSFTLSPTIPFSPQQISSSPNPSLIFNSRIQAYNNASFDNSLFLSSSAGQGQSYSDIYSQMLDHNSTMYTAALGHSSLDLQMTNEERWRNWRDGETRRRILVTCFIIDNHAAMYHQQPRARNDVDPSLITLTGPSDALWDANSADEWAAVLAANPAAGTSQSLPHPNTLTPEEVAKHSYFDQVAILSAETLRLPRRRHRRSMADEDDELEDNNSSSPDDLRTPTTASFGQGFSRGAAATMTRAEDRIAHLFSKAFMSPLANVYLALHHTPLHDLLAVSGDSYVFCQKVLNAPTFMEHQKRLRAWAEGRFSGGSPTSPHGPSIPASASAASATTTTATAATTTSSSTSTSIPTTGLEGLSSAKATVYAARALVGFLDRGLDASNGITPYVTCISNYWGMYTCALVIWAFSHRAGRPSSSSVSASGAGTGNSPNKGGAASEEEAITWLRLVSEASQPEQVARMRGRREASAGVVSMVRRRLEADCVGPRSQLYVDAVGVLRKLEEEVNRRRF